MFRKSRSRANLRKRFTEHDDVDEESLLNGNKQSAAKIKQLEKVNKTMGNESIVVTKTNNLLSFDNLEDDDVAEFKVRRKGHHKRLERLASKVKYINAREMKLGRAGETAPFTLEELKRELSDENMEDSSESYNCEQVAIEEILSPEPNDDIVYEKFPNSYSGAIPDAQAVYEARKKREKLRRVGEGVIPIDDKTHKSVARSRLVREDDNDLSDDGEDRIYSSQSLLNGEEERRRNQESEFLSVEQRDDEQSDEESTMWESEQMKKGVSSYKVEMLERERQKLATLMRTLVANYQKSQETSESQPMEMDMDIDVSDSRAINAPAQGILPVSSVSISHDGIISKLIQNISGGEEVLNAREAELKRIEQNIEENKDTLSTLTMQKPLLRDKFNMYQELRVYLRDLLECLNEKLADIMHLESRMSIVLSSRTHRLVQRRRQDIHDVYDECSAAGRCITRTPEAVQRSAEREARRARRRELRENTLAGISHAEGMSSDDEETSAEITIREQTNEEIKRSVGVVFLDTLDEFSHVKKVIARFVDWLAIDQQSFVEAYIHLCIPKLVSLFVRLEMILWNPLENSDLTLCSMQWYKDLLTCGMDNSNIDSEHPIIVSFIPLCIEKIVIPRLLELIREVWDPLSLRQTQSLVNFLDELFECCPLCGSNSRNLKLLLTAIHERAQGAIDEDLFVPIYSNQALTNPSSGCKQFIDRQYWTSIKLMQSISLLSTIISEDGLRVLLLDGIINRFIIVAMQCFISTDPSIIQKCRAIYNVVPNEWWKEVNRPPVRNLVNILGNIAEDYKSSESDFWKEIIDVIKVGQL